MEGKFIGEAKGRVLNWDAIRKFGFARIIEKKVGEEYEVVGTSEDAFVYHDQIQMDGLRKLIVGQIIEFEMYRNKKGIKAGNVRIVGEAFDDEGEINGNC